MELPLIDPTPSAAAWAGMTESEDDTISEIIRFRSQRFTRFLLEPQSVNSEFPNSANLLMNGLSVPFPGG